METGWFHMTQGRPDPGGACDVAGEGCCHPMSCQLARRRDGGRRAAVYKRLLEHPGLAR